MKRISDDESSSGGGTRIQSVARASGLLTLVARRQGGITASEAARDQRLGLSTAYHLLNTLAAEGLLVKDSSRRYWLGPRIGLLAEAYSRVAEPAEYLRTALRTLADESGETAYVAAWRNDEIRVLASCEGANAVRVAAVERGPYEHPHARATGKLLLAFAPDDRRAALLARWPLVPVTPNTITGAAAFERELERIRRAGRAEDRDEFVQGISCVAAPVLVDDRPIAVFTVSAPSERYARHRERLRDAVARAAGSVGQARHRGATAA